MKAIRAKAPHAKVEFNDGTDPAAAAALAKSAQVAIVFVNRHTSEGKDLPTLTLPDNQDALVSAVAAANPHTIVVLETGGPATMHWIGQVSAAIEVWYPDIRGAEALANILFGDVNPSGKLPVSFAKFDSELPHPQIPGSDLKGPANAPWKLPDFNIDHTEGLKVGYKWFDAQDKVPLFPFGHGLSNTTFAYSGLKAELDKVSLTVRNTGKRAGPRSLRFMLGSRPPPRNRRNVLSLGRRWNSRQADRRPSRWPSSRNSYPSSTSRRTTGACCPASTSSSRAARHAALR